MTKINDATHPFEIGHEKFSLFQQYELLRKKPKTLSSETRANIRRGMIFMESSQLDEIASLVGYDSLFVNRAFDAAKVAIKLRSEIYDELLMLPAQRATYEVKIKKLKEERLKEKAAKETLKELRGVV